MIAYFELSAKAHRLQAQCYRMTAAAARLDPYNLPGSDAEGRAAHYEELAKSYDAFARGDEQTAANLRREDEVDHANQA